MPTDGAANPKTSRRLAAILAADIAGYSALMGADEADTVRSLKEHQAVILPMITEHGGRVIDIAGDGILAEFSSVVNAVEGAVAIQKVMAERNANIPTERQMRYRIGVNLGDVIHDEQRVYGDGVNIAARLESIAEPGGICISGEAFAQVQRKLPLRFLDIGEQPLKNITGLIRVYRIDTAQHVLGTRTKPILTLPDKPSIAALPFTNLSGDAKEDYFSDGITEDIITELSRFSELFVIARNSSFQYKGKVIDVRQVRRDLGVRYILQGSIRREAGRVRISAQLADAVTGAHRWAERYDRRLEDVFAIQDEMACTIAPILAAHVNKAEIERTIYKAPETWQAYDYYLRAADKHASFWSSFNAAELYEVRGLLERSLAIDPNYARAYARLAWTHIAAWVNALDGDYLNPAALDRAYHLAGRAVQLDPNLPEAHAVLGQALCRRRQHEAAIAEFERAMALNPNFTDWRFAEVLVYAGYAARAIEVVERHMRLDPFHMPLAAQWLGSAHYMLKQYPQALPRLQEYVSRSPNSRGGRVWLAATHAQLGNIEQARAEAAEVLRIEPTWTIEGTQAHQRTFKPWKTPSTTSTACAGRGCRKDNLCHDRQISGDPHVCSNSSTVCCRHLVAGRRCRRRTSHSATSAGPFASNGRHARRRVQASQPTDLRRWMLDPRPRNRGSTDEFRSVLVFGRISLSPGSRGCERSAWDGCRVFGKSVAAHY